MVNVLRRGAVVVVAALGLALTGTATPASAATAAALPPVETWLADVSAVTDQAGAYLTGRLPDTRVKTAIVLDIDNTAMETTYAGAVWPPATPPVLALAKQAQSLGAVVFFVTNRPDILQPWTVGNLSSAGYTWAALYMRPTFSSDSAQTLKTNYRIKIESAGYTIVANVGNNDSDLLGGHAERTFKLPDYDGQLD
ncbi:HAD family acid phosphatase [Actinoplanes sp. NPDC026619]|uniref:HAD family acid phosphatase n=1 Tax=Actinoplanes sp. NPDC026619 TaxID=3155798 RepID=UPI0033CD9E22